MSILPVIMCGGSGSRLWPVSRKAHPKPFINLPDGETLLGKTYRRILQLNLGNEILTVTNQELLFKTEDEYSRLAKSISAASPSIAEAHRLSYILEPEGRNTAPAVAAAALYAQRQYGDEAVLLVLAADHLIKQEEAFAQAVTCAIHLAKEGKHVTFGIQPSYPETGYGYIEADLTKPFDWVVTERSRSAQGTALVERSRNQHFDRLNDHLIEAEAYSVKSFVEKPDAATAASYLSAGNYYWNSGIFCFKVGQLLAELAEFVPQVLKTTQVAMQAAKLSTSSSQGQVLRLSQAEFNQVPAISIDYALMEKSTNTAVVPCDIGWSDIGSWPALGDLFPADEQGNRTSGKVLLQKARNNYVQSPKRLTAVLGVDDLILVDTADALLVAHKSQAQAVKDIVAQLSATNHQTALLHQKVYRPWGSYTTLEEGPGFKIKRIEVKPAGSLSLQLHYHRSEHWVVVSGLAKVTNNGEEFFLRANESTFILAGNKHRLENPGITPLVMIEVQSGDYLGEDDIVRFEDNYGRA